MCGAKINRLEVDPALGDSITMESELMPIKNICDRLLPLTAGTSLDNKKDRHWTRNRLKLFPYNCRDPPLLSHLRRALMTLAT